MEKSHELTCISHKQSIMVVSRNGEVWAGTCCCTQTQATNADVLPCNMVAVVNQCTTHGKIAETVNFKCFYHREKVCDEVIYILTIFI